MENLPIASGDELPSAPVRYLGFGATLELSWRLLADRFARLAALIIACSVLFCFGLILFFCFALLCREEASLLLLLMAMFLVFVLALFLMENIACFSLLGDGRLRVGDAFNASSSFLLSYIKGLCALAVIGSGLCLPFILMAVFLMLALAFYAAIASFSGSSPILALAPAVYGMGALVACFVALFALLSFFCLSLLQSFFSFSLIIDRRPVRESLAYAFGLIRRHPVFVLGRALLFMFFYLLATGLLVFFSNSDPSLPLAICISIMNFLLNFYLVAFIYTLYRNLQMMDGPAAEERDRRTIKHLLQLGLAILFFPLLALGALLLMAYISHPSPAPSSSPYGQIEQASLPVVRL